MSYSLLEFSELMFFCLNKWNDLIVFESADYLPFEQNAIASRTLSIKRGASYFGVCPSYKKWRSACLWFGGGNICNSQPLIILFVFHIFFILFNSLLLYYHFCSVKDVAIAYGYNNVPKSKPKSMTIGGRQPLNRFSDKIRAEVRA
jgi:hypothetical protein